MEAQKALAEARQREQDAQLELSACQAEVAQCAPMVLPMVGPGQIIATVLAALGQAGLQQPQIMAVDQALKTAMGVPAPPPQPVQAANPFASAIEVQESQPSAEGDGSDKEVPFGSQRPSPFAAAASDRERQDAAQRQALQERIQQAEQAVTAKANAVAAARTWVQASDTETTKAHLEAAEEEQAQADAALTHARQELCDFDKDRQEAKKVRVA